MKYIFTYKDHRRYKGDIEDKISIESEQISGGNIKIVFKESENNIIDLTLSKREAAAIISALSAAKYECVCHVSI